MRIEIGDLVRRAFPLMNAGQRAEAERLFADLGQTANAAALEEVKEQAREAFEADMQPVCTAIASALHANDLAALKGLRTLLPGLLREVNQSPALADLLALQLGTAFLEGLTAP